MLTPWGEKLDKNNVLPEYPRPQLVRDSYLNLNGVWNYAITASSERPTAFDGEIVVPFSPESELSGVGRTLGNKEYLWYYRKFELPEGFGKGRYILHFGAVDQIATVWVNGMEFGTHVGGFTPFSIDVTEAITDNILMILVRVQDETDTSSHSRGKQKTKRGGIWYTPQSGIWQTVWMESVPDNYIKTLRITPCYDEQAVELFVEGEGKCVAVCEGMVHPFPAGEAFKIPVSELHSWTPDDPYLYPLTVTLGDDKVESYFAMRKFSVEKASDGHRRLHLNGEPLFHNGLLDQGYWSDGLLTAPSDEALIYDIETAKAMGFNMLRKHIKLEPLRWYYHCDRLGMLVWQDMPNGGGRYKPLVISAPLATGRHLKDSHYGLFARRDVRGRTEYYHELREMITTLYNCPCIAMWVPFNEGWGQFDARKACEMIWRMDQTRTIDHASGWHDQYFGETKSLHVYFKKYVHKPDKLGRCVMLTEFGGYNHRIDGHSFNDKDFGYKRFASANSYKYAFWELYDKEIYPAQKQGLSASVYTQLTDVEDELNGLITYDRRVVKIAPVEVKGIVGKLR